MYIKHVYYSALCETVLFTNKAVIGLGYCLKLDQTDLGTHR